MSVPLNLSVELGTRPAVGHFTGGWSRRSAAHVCHFSRALAVDHSLFAYPVPVAQRCSEAVSGLGVGWVGDTYSLEECCSCFSGFPSPQ